MRSPTPKSRQATKRERAEAERKQFIAANPTPYEGWEDAAGVKRSAIQSAMTRANQSCLPTWSKDKTRKPKPLTLDDLAVGYFAVERVGPSGLSYGQLDKCFRTTTGRACHRAKAAAIMAALVSLELIAKVGNYSAGRRGNSYRIVRAKFDPSKKILEI